jgi:hypothetical protein
VALPAAVAPLVVNSDSNGRASAVLTSPTSGAFVVTAYLGSSDAGTLIGTVTVTFEEEEQQEPDPEDPEEEDPPVADASQSELSTSADKAATGSSVTLTVQVRDQNGDALAHAGVSVTFASELGQLSIDGGTFLDAGDRLTVTTTAAGTATAHLKSDSDGMITATAHLGANEAAPQVGSVSVEFGSVVLNDLTVTYDGQQHALVAEFSNDEAAIGASYTYERAGGSPSSEAPRDAGVYTVTVTPGAGYPGSATATLTIERLELGFSSPVTYADKAYDGGSAATATATLDVGGIVAGDQVSLAPQRSGEFQVFEGGQWVPSKQVAAYPNDASARVIGTLVLQGSDAGNYFLTQPLGSATITQRAITVNALDVADKVYDGTTDALWTGSIVNAIATDDVDLEADFTSAAVGSDIPVTIVVVGDDASNYSLEVIGLSASITARDLVITANDRNKVYGDDLVMGTTEFATTGLVEGESLAGVTLSSAAAAATSDVGTYDILAADPVAAVGTELGNYSVSFEAGTLTVEPRLLTITPSAELGKAYGDADPELTYTFDGLVNEDLITGGLGREEGEDVGTYAFTLGDLGVDHGSEAVNYTLALIDEPAQFSITARQVEITPAPAQSKTYGDEDPVFAYSVTVGSLVGDDAFAGSLSRDEGATVGSYAYTLGDLSVDDGNDGTNYSLTLGTADTFVVLQRAVTVAGTFLVADRAYDGSTATEITTDELELLNTVEGDDVALSPVAAFDDRHVAADKTVTLTAATSLVGEDAANYLLDLTGAPTTTATVTKADITFDITNKDTMTYNGLARGVNVVTDPAPAPSIEPVAYNLQYSRIKTASGEDVNEGVSALRAAGQYRVTVTSTDPRYAGQDEIIVTIAARPITLTAAPDGKTYGAADPDLAPVLVEGTLGNGDALTGLLAYGGTDAGAYDYLLGTVAVMRSGADASDNYTITVSGTFTVAPAPVTFDIANSDDTVDGIHVFERDGSELVGLDILSDPVGMTDYLLSYRRTHDQNHQAIPLAQQSVSGIEALGTYVVSIESLNPNYAGVSDRVVWLTDGIDLGSMYPLDDEEQPVVTPGGVNELMTMTIPFLNAGGTPRALGPLPVTFDLTVAPLSGLEFFDLDSGDPITSIVVPAGATQMAFGIKVTALHTAPYQVTVQPSGTLAGTVVGMTFPVEAQADLVVLGSDIEVGEDAASAVLTVQLQDANGLAVLAPADMALTLVGDAGLTFLAAGTDSSVTGVTVPSGSSSATFRVSADTAGEYGFSLENASAVPGVSTSSVHVVTVNPKPVVTSVSPAVLDIGATTQVVITGANFAAGAGVSIQGLSVTDVVVDSDTQMTVTVSASVVVPVGALSVIVTNLDGGTGTLAAGLEVVKPTLTANADAANLVEGGSIDLPKATLLANDVSSSGIEFSYLSFGSAQNVTVVDNGATLRVSSTGLMGDGASLAYTIQDVLGTQSSATVTFSITLPPQDAVVFTDPADLAAYTADYEPPTFQEVFQTWPRASNNAYYPDPSQPMGGAAGSWVYDSGNDRVVQPVNTSTHEVIVSPADEALEFYEFEATLWSSDTDDDSVGLVIAFVRDGATNKYLVAHRTQGGNSPNGGWGISYFNGTSMTALTNVSVGGTSGSGWGNRSSRIKAMRNGDTITAWASHWNDLANFGGEMEIDLDANTINGIAVAPDLSVFKGKMQYGYYTYSQANSTYLDIEITGGLSRDLAYLLTNGTDGDDAGSEADRWTGSEVWQFNATALTWDLQVGRTIQDDLRFPRIVTSVAPIDPSDPDSAPSGTQFEVRENEVVLLSLP